MSDTRRVRIYDLARELKQDTKLVIEHLRREGADVSVPSNSVSKELADRIRHKYLPKNNYPHIHYIRIIKKNGFTTTGRNSIIILFKLPISWKFTFKESYDFDHFLGLFDWSLHDAKIEFDFTSCRYANYQALSLLILYIWYLKRNRCEVEIKYGETGAQSVTTMWKNLGAQDLLSVLDSSIKNFPDKKSKPLFAIRNFDDANKALSTVGDYTKNFSIEYEKTLRHIISELLYNTMEHGRNYHIPSLLQFSWYRDKSELSFIVADLGIGIREHLRQTYFELETDVEAIELALKPQVSGTFGKNGQPYEGKNNAGVGLYISSSIIKRLHADMYIVSGNGLVHVSPLQVTKRELNFHWNGTFVYVTVKIGSVKNLTLQNMMIELTQTAVAEMSQADSKEQKQSFYLNINNYFGRFAEDKSLAIKLRNTKLIPSIDEKKTLTIDFEDVTSATHSLLNALLATPIQKLGMTAYKKIKIINASPEIREIIDFIFDENTIPA